MGAAIWNVGVAIWSAYEEIVSAHEGNVSGIWCTICDGTHPVDRRNANGAPSGSAS